MYINIRHHEIFHPIIPPTIQVLKYMCNFSNFAMNIILLQIYFICSTSSMFVGFLKIIDCIKFKVNLFLNNNNLRCDVHTLLKKIIAKILYL